MKMNSRAAKKSLVEALVLHRQKKKREEKGGKSFI